MSKPISRRLFVRSGVTGLGAAVPLGLLGKDLSSTLVTPPSVPSAGQQDTPLSADPVDDLPDAAPQPNPEKVERDAALAQLVAPIAVGMQLGGTSITAVAVDPRGLGVVTITDERGRQWDAEVARRTSEDTALNPLALSKHYSVYLRNGGTGHTPTDESVGLTVLAIADNVRRNEDSVTSLTLASRTEVWASTGYRHADV